MMIASEVWGGLTRSVFPQQLTQIPMITCSGRQTNANSSALNPTTIHNTRPIMMTTHPTTFSDIFCVPFTAHETVLAVNIAVERMNVANMTPFGGDFVDLSISVLETNPR